eukprot:1343161-Amorphochlora_amoeboformis.AAC.2
MHDSVFNRNLQPGLKTIHQTLRRLPPLDHSIRVYQIQSGHDSQSDVHPFRPHASWTRKEEKKDHREITGKRSVEKNDERMDRMEGNRKGGRESSDGHTGSPTRSRPLHIHTSPLIYPDMIKKKYIF